MRIAQFTDTFLPIVDGVGRVVSNYAALLPSLGHDCYVVAPMADTGYRGGLPYELVEFLSVNVPMQRQYNTGLPLLDPHYEARMNRIELDIIHAHSPFIAGQEALRQGRRMNVPVVGTFHSRYYDDFYHLTKTDMLADIGVRFIVNFYERCDEVWAVSQSSADTLHDYGYKGDITVMPNGTPNVRPSAQNRDAARQRFHLPDSRVLFYCGQLNWKKNILRILEACALLKADGARFTLVLTGQGPDARAIVQKAEELGIGSDTILTGHVTDESLLYGLYEAATLFVFPSLYDTSGMVVREAAAMQTPSVTVLGSAAAEPVTDGVNGLLCEDATESLAHALKTALDNPAKCLRMGQNARESIYSPWIDIVSRAVERYDRLIKTHPPLDAPDHGKDTEEPAPLKRALSKIRGGHHEG